MSQFRTYWVLLRFNADFRRLYLARLVSFAGDWFLVVPLLGLVYEATDSAFAASAVLAAHALPAALLAPLTGMVSDRFDRKTVMVVSDLVRAVLALGLLATDSIGSVWYPLLLVFFEGAGAAFFYPASTGSLPNVVSEEELPAATTLMSSAWGTMAAVGAAAGGVFATVVSRDAAFIVNAASFLLSAILIARVVTSLQDQTAVSKDGRRSNADAFRYIFSHRRARALLSSKGVHSLYSGGAVSLFAVMSITIFETGDAGTGALFGARGLGNTIGPMIGLAIFGSSTKRLLGSIGWMMALWGVGYLLVGFAPSLLLASVAVCLAHMGGGAQFTFSTYGLQELMPDNVRGRVFALDFALHTLAITISALIVGALAEAFPIRGLFMSLGLIAIVFGSTWSAITHSYWDDAELSETPQDAHPRLSKTSCGSEKHTTHIGAYGWWLRWLVGSKTTPHIHPCDSCRKPWVLSGMPGALAVVSSSVSSGSKFQLRASRLSASCSTVRTPKGIEKTGYRVRSQFRAT